MDKKVVYHFTTIDDGNLAYHVDNNESASSNREKLSIKLGYANEDLVYMNQVHGANIEVVDENSSKLIENCDAIITNKKNLPLMVMVADCIPILLFDNKVGVVAAIHAGRNSTFLEISKKTLQKMMDDFFCNPKDVKAVFGPSIRKCCYEVNDDLSNIVRKSFGAEFVENNYIDLQEINKKQLNSLGLEDVEILPICTKCSNEPYFSYRKDKKTGRFAGIVFLKD